jgi:hypothetical protein
MKIVQKTTEENCLWQWAKAEAYSKRFGDKFNHPQIPNLKAALRSSQKLQDLSAMDLIHAKELTTQSRAYFLKDLLPLKPDWHICELQYEELPYIELPAYPPFLQLAPNRTLKQFVSKLEDGNKLLQENMIDPDDFDKHFHEMKRDFDPNKMNGLPILVGDTESGPFQVIEGCLRLSTLTSLYLKRTEPNLKIEVLIGISPQLKTIPLYR